MDLCGDDPARAVQRHLADEGHLLVREEKKGASYWGLGFRV